MHTKQGGEQLDYNQAIELSLRFIETHIKEEITPEQIAGSAGYSVFHFCRLFALIQGVPLMEYVRKRRLTLSRSALLSDTRIIDVALDYGFETASGYAKAFRKEYGYSPTTYITRMKQQLSDGMAATLRRYVMNPIIMRKPAFKVAGYGIKTNISTAYLKDIAAYWESYEGENLESKMYRQLDPPEHGEVGLCVPGDKEQVSYLLGVIVEDFSKVSSDMMTVEVPAAEYAVFTTPMPHPDDGNTHSLSSAIKATWKYIFEEWFETSGYVYDDNGIDFEFYDERCHCDETAIAEIYIPIKPR